MNKFIKDQIDSYDGMIYDINKIANKKVNGLFIVVIKSNKIYADIFNDFMSRKKMILLILSNMLDKYQLDDTTLFINIKDGYYWNDENDNYPVFSFAVPKGKKGLIFPNFDMCHFDLLSTDFNGVKNIFSDYDPKFVTNDLYFKGGPSSEKKTKIREKTACMTCPFNIKVLKDYTEPIYKVKDHKYLLDLPGVKPWSVRFKYLLLSERLVIRISLFNSKYDETGYWRQSYDYFFDENIDYIHLVYDVDYDRTISENTYAQIKKDLMKIYEYFESHQLDYNKTVENLKNKIKNFNVDETYSYLHKLIQEYTLKLFKQ